MALSRFTTQTPLNFPLMSPDATRGEDDALLSVCRNLHSGDTAPYLHLITGREVMATYGIRRRRRFVGNLLKLTQVIILESYFLPSKSRWPLRRSSRHRAHQSIADTQSIGPRCRFHLSFGTLTITRKSSSRISIKHQTRPFHINLYQNITCRRPELLQNELHLTIFYYPSALARRANHATSSDRQAPRR